MYISTDHIFKDDVATTTAATTGGLSDALTQFICIIIIVAAASLELFIARKIYNSIKKKNDISDAGEQVKNRFTAIRIIYSTIRFLIIASAVLLILAAFGINVTGIVAGLGIVGAFGAIAVQDTIKDLVTGYNIVSEHYFSIGDTIEFDKYIGKITSVSMRSTKITTYDGSEVTIQNHLINKVKKLSKENKIIVPLPYELERNKAYELGDKIAEAVSKVPNVESAKPSGIEAFSGYSIDYAFMFYCEPIVAKRTSRLVNVAIINTLDEADVKIPYDKLEIYNMSDVKLSNLASQVVAENSPEDQK